MLILRVAKELNKRKIPYATVGGHAVALHGALRGTVDIDLVIKWNKKNLEIFEGVMKALGLQSRVPINSEDLFNFRDEYIEKRNLIAWNFTNPANPTEQIDLVVNYDLSGKKIDKVVVKGVTLPILSKNELIAMKKLSGRDQDLEDIKALKKL